MQPAAASHPALMVFGNTTGGSYPLILVVGREPNNNVPMAPTLGTYDFRAAPHCAFWNTSYGLLGRVVGLTTRQLKAVCESKGGSPLCYADCFPVTIPNAIVNKKVIKQDIPQVDVRAHIDSIFAFDQILSRVELVLLSGVRDKLYDVSTRAIRAACASLHIPVDDVPFFYPTNFPLKDPIKLSPNSQLLVQSIFERF